jgi:DNA repair exonuclease SbcCD nuclease subunit
VIIAHLADLHLGFSAYESHDCERNVREADVADLRPEAFARALELAPSERGVLSLRPLPVGAAVLLLIA